MSDNLQKSKNISVFVLLLSALLIVAVYFSAKNLFADYQEKKIAEQAEPKQSKTVPDTEKREVYFQPLNLTESQNIKINPTQEYNGLSKSEIYAIRSKYVEESIFAGIDYHPSEEVFGQIENYKKWWGLNHYRCHKDDTTSGVSAMSRYINNPAILISPMNAYVYSNVEKYGNRYNHYCNAEYTKFIPYKMSYDANSKTITATYQIHREIIDNAESFGSKDDPFYLTMIGMNGRDLGYPYIKISALHNITMKNDYNASMHVYTLADYIHVGGSCGVSEGCNNISPYQSELDFRFTDLPASIEVNFWHNFPKKETQTPDIKYKMQFVEIYE